MPPSQQQTPSSTPPNQYPGSAPEIPTQAQPQRRRPWLGSKKRQLLFGGIVLVVLLVVGTIGALAYYNNPSKVLSDALANTIATRSATFNGTLTFDNKDQNDPAKVVASFSGQGTNSGSATINAKATVTAAGKTYDVTADLVNVDQTTYIRLANVKQALESAITDPLTLAFYETFVQKIDNTWIQLDSSGPFITSSSACQDALKAFKLSDADRSALRQIFSHHQFITVRKQLANQTVNGKDSLHYQINTDTKVESQFEAEALKVEPIKKVNEACGSTADTQTTTDNTPAPQVELWVDAWSHKPTKLLITQTEDSTTTTVDLQVKLDAPVNIQKPNGAKSLKDLFGQMLEPQAADQSY